MWLSNPAACDALRSANIQLELLEHSGYAAPLVGDLQRDKLARLWERADHVPHYRGLPGWGHRDLSRLPVTEKDDVKTRPDDFTRDDLGAPLKYYESSGTGGRPTPTPRLAEDIIHNVVGVAGLWRRVLGNEPSRVVAVLPSDVVPVCDFVASTCEYLGHTLLRSYPFSVGMCDWDRLEALFTSYRPRHVFAAPGVLLQWTRILKSRGRLEQTCASVDTIMLLGEVSMPAQRRKLMADWGAGVFDASYGSTETGTIAATCERGGLHLLLTGHHVELRSRGVVEPAAPGASGELVVTPLNNYARPLLRYATGDLVDIGAGPCPCGLPLPLVRVRGRGSDGIALRGTVLSEQLVGSIVYDDPRLTGYLVQLRGDGTGGRLVLEKDVDVTDEGSVMAAAAARRFAEAGLVWDDVVVVSQLPQASKSGASQKNWKRTNVAVMS